MEVERKSDPGRGRIILKKKKQKNQKPGLEKREYHPSKEQRGIH